MANGVLSLSIRRGEGQGGVSLIRLHLKCQLEVGSVAWNVKDIFQFRENKEEMKNM